MSSRIKYLCLLAVGFVGLSFFILPNKASAINYSDFKPGRIIDDVVFTNKSSMTVDQIQAFLNSKVPVCETRKQVSFTGGSGTVYYAPFTCLKDYQENITTGVNNYGKYAADNVTPLPVAGGIDAAQIIWQVAQDYNINPQVLLVTLQKEQGLITDTWPILPQFTKATGYRCPDSVLGIDVDTNRNGCYDSSEGFYKQVLGTGWQLRNDFNGIGTVGFWSPFKKGINTILYNPDPGCGSKVVNIETQATAILYKYTPYTPNDAAIAAAPGVVVPCGAYGNRNFWRLFTSWFGSTTVPNASIQTSQSISVAGDRFIGSELTIGYQVSNTGTYPIDTGSLWICATFNGITISGGLTRATLSPGQNLSVTIKRTFDKVGQLNAWICGDVPNGKGWTPNYPYTISPTISNLTTTISPSPILISSSVNASTTSPRVGEATTLSYTVRNTGSVNADTGFLWICTFLNGVGTGGGGNRQTLAPNATMTLTMSYTPSQTGALTVSVCGNTPGGPGWVPGYPAAQTAGILRTINANVK